MRRLVAVSMSVVRLMLLSVVCFMGHVSLGVVADSDRIVAGLLWVVWFMMMRFFRDRVIAVVSVMVYATVRVATEDVSSVSEISVVAGQDISASTDHVPGESELLAVEDKEVSVGVEVLLHSSASFLEFCDSLLVFRYIVGIVTNFIVIVFDVVVVIRDAVVV